MITIALNNNNTDAIANIMRCSFKTELNENDNHIASHQNAAGQSVKYNMSYYILIICCSIDMYVARVHMDHIRGWSFKLNIEKCRILPSKVLTNLEKITLYGGKVGLNI